MECHHWVIGAIFWPHPLIWSIRSSHVVACEYAADAESTRHLGDTEVYARTLAKVALTATNKRRVVGLAMARVSDVRRRLN